MNLVECYGITDVSALGNVHTLMITHCTGIRDVSALANVSALRTTGYYRLRWWWIFAVKKAAIETIQCAWIIVSLRIIVCEYGVGGGWNRTILVGGG